MHKKEDGASRPDPGTCPDCGGDCLRTRAADVFVGLIPAANTKEWYVMVLMEEGNGEPMAHYAMEPERAREMARELLRAADMAENTPPREEWARTIRH